MSWRSWWNRKVIVRRADPDQDVMYCCIDSADGTDPQEIYLSRQDTFSFAWVMGSMLDKEKERGSIRQISVTITHQRKDDNDDVRVIYVPDWAKYKLTRQLLDLSFKTFGWDGVCPTPTKHTAYR